MCSDSSFLLKEFNYLKYVAIKRGFSPSVITFSYPCIGRESIVFGLDFRNGDFDGVKRYEDHRPSYNYFVGWAQVRTPLGTLSYF